MSNNDSLPPPGRLSAGELASRLAKDSGLLRSKLYQELEICRDFETAIPEPPGANRDLPAHCRPRDLRSTGWGIVFHPDDEPLMRRSLGLLLDHRRYQAGALYKEVVADPALPPRRLLWANESPGTIDPEYMPYYLVIFGGPDRVSFTLQTLLSLNHAVGRLAFDEPDDYGRYVRSVLAAEKRAADRATPGKATVFSVENGDRATEVLSQYLVPPVLEVLRRRSDNWNVTLQHDDRAYKADLLHLLHHDLPDLLLLSCHGKACKPGHVDQRERQGALVCGDWVDRGPGSPGSTEAEALHAGDIDPGACFDGLFAFCFACFGGGTPLEDNFPHESQNVIGHRPVVPKGLAVEPFVARLPQVMLAQGALAFLGHLDRGWTYSFCWHLAETSQAQQATASLQDAIGQVLDGDPVGHALRPIHRRRSVLAAHLLAQLERQRQGEEVDEVELAELWTAHNDARNFILLGDPAVVLPAARGPAPLDDLQSASGSPSSPGAHPTQPDGTGTPPPPVAGDEIDLHLQVESAHEGGHRLRYQLSIRSTSGSQTRNFESRRLRREPFDTFRAAILEVENLASSARPSFDPIRRLRGQGQDLFAELFPADLQQVLQTFADLSSAASSSADIPGKVWLEILSDELWVPWELLWIPRSNGQGCFLGEAFLVTRHLHDCQYPLALPLDSVALVIPRDSELPETGPEGEDLRRLLESTGRRVENISARYQPLVERLEQGGFGGWHFSGHGIAAGTDPARWSFVLEDGESLTPADLPPAKSWSDQCKPLVFLNACHGSLQGDSLTRPGGLAAKFLRAGAGAVVGASWRVDDATARRFAVSFYRRFLDGSPLAEAVQLARLESRAAGGEDPSWLAFTVFGHPRATCRPPTSASDGAPPRVYSEQASGKEAEPTDGHRGEAKIFESPGPPPTEEPRNRSWLRRSIGLALVVLAVFGSLRTPTRIQLDLTLGRVVFEVAGETPHDLFSSVLGFSSLAIDRFRMLTFPADETGDSSRTLLSGPGGAVSFEPAEPDGTDPQQPVFLGTLGFGPLARGTRVDLRAHPAGSSWADLSVDLSPYSSPDLSFDRPYRMFAQLVTTDDGRSTLDGMTTLGHPSQDRRFVELTGGDRGLAVTATITRSDKPLLVGEELPVSHLELVDQGSTGELETTLRQEGQIIYPEHPGIPAVTLGADNFLRVEDLRLFRITRLALDPATGFLRLQATGIAGLVRSGPGELGNDRRLRRWQQWLPGSPWLWTLVGFGCGAWLVVGRGRRG